MAAPLTPDPVVEAAAVTRQQVKLAASDINSIEQRWGLPTSLLPNNESILDHAQELADAARYPLPFGDVVRCKDPYACDERILPFLAWERSTDLWKSHWPLMKRRYVTDQSFPMQRKKGTDVGIRTYVSIMDGKVLRIDAPPLLAFPGRNQTPEERAAWLAQFPQLRLFPFSTYGNSQLAFFSTNQKIMALDGVGVNDTVIIGHNVDPAGNQTQNLAGFLIGQSIEVPYEWEIESLSINVATAAGHAILGIYDTSGGNPGNLISSTASLPINQGWNTFSVNPVLLQPGTYVLAFMLDNNAAGISWDTTLSTQLYASGLSFPLPNLFPAALMGNNTYLLYATFNTVIPVGPVQSIPAFYPPPAEQCFPKIDMAKYLWNKTFLFKDGVQTPVDFYETQVQGADGVFTEYNQIVLPGSTEGCWFLNGFPREGLNPTKILMVEGEVGYFPISLNLLVERTITSLQNNPPIDSDPLVFSATTVSPGLAPISVYPDTIYKDGPIKLGEWYSDRVPMRSEDKVNPRNSRAYIVDGTWGFFPVEDRARYNIYKVLYLYDPKSPLDAPRKSPSNARMFLDHTYLQYPAYRARVVVEVFGTLPKCDRQFYNGRDMYLTNLDMSILWDQITAVRASKSARDLIYVDTKTYDIATPNITVRCGQIKSGQVVPILNV